MGQLGSSQLGRQFVGGSIDYLSTEPTSAETSTLSLDAVEPSALHLGSSEVGAAYLGGSITSIALQPASSQTSTKSLASTTIVDTTVNTESVTTDTKVLNTVSLSPENIFIKWNDQKQEFTSNWFTKETPIDEAGELVIVGTFRNNKFDSIDVIVERDDTDDGVADTQTEIHTFDSDNHILRIETDENEEEIAEVGGKYRLRFPNYDQTDALARFTMALGWDNDIQFNGEWDISPVSTESQPAKALVAVLLSENYRLDATIDEIFESQHISKSNDRSLEFLSHENGTSRKENETDPHLRKRVLAKSATRTFSSVGSDFTDLIGLIFEDQSDKVGVGVASNEPVLQIEVPTTVMEDHILTAAEVEDLIDDAVSSSYDATVTTI